MISIFFMLDMAVDNKKSISETLDMHEWEQLYVPDKILQALKELQFTSPTPIQCLTLPSAIRDRMNILGASETGSGKTLAFGIPMLARISCEKDKLRSKLACLSQDKSSDTHLEETDDFEVVENLVNDMDNDGDVDQPPDEEELLHTWKDDEVEPDLSLIIEEIDPQSNQTTRIAPVPNISKSSVSLESCINTNLYGLVITPTRELAIQVADHIKQIARYTDITVGLVFGGMSQEKQQRLLRKCPQIVVATPGRLWEFIEQREPHLCKVNQVKTLVIDEADRLFESGHFAELKLLFDWINTQSNKKSVKKRQIFVFSATLTFVHRGAQTVEKKGKKKKTISLTKEKKLADLMSILGLSDNVKVIDATQRVEKLSEYKVYCSLEDKDLYLWYFLRLHPGRTLIFCNSKAGVRRLTSVLTLLEYKPLVLHADMHQKQRLKNLDRFVSNPKSILLASDVAARGLDIPHVHHVIHFDVPRTAELYLHRSGRTARASRSGISLLLLQPADLPSWRKICLSLKKQDKEIPQLEEDLTQLNSLRSAVALARHIDGHENSISKSKSRRDWFSKMAKEADLELDSELIDEDEIDHSGRKQQDLLKNDLKEKRMELTNFIAYLNNEGKNKSIVKKSPKSVKSNKMSKPKGKNFPDESLSTKNKSAKIVKDNSEMIRTSVDVLNPSSDQQPAKKKRREIEAELKKNSLNQLISPRYPAIATTLKSLQEASGLKSGLKSRRKRSKNKFKIH